MKSQLKESTNLRRNRVWIELFEHVLTQAARIKNKHGFLLSIYTATSTSI